MTPTLRNRIKVWWHCLIRFHRGATLWSMTIGPWERKDVYCADCEYGRHV